MKRSKSRDDPQPNAWKTVPRWAIVVFLLAVFFIFASFGFVFDGMDMGRQPALCLAFSVVIIALFATFYAVAGITLRQRFWIPAVPLFILENVCMVLLHNWLPDAPPLTHLDSAQLSGFHNRLIFDGVAVVISVVLGYIRFCRGLDCRGASPHSGLSSIKPRWTPNWLPPAKSSGSWCPKSCRPLPGTPSKASTVPPHRSAEISFRSSRSVAAKPLSSSATSAAKGSAPP